MAIAKVTYHGIRGTRKEMNQAKKRAMRSAAQMWKDKYLPHHFSHAAFFRYPHAYIRRSAGYDRRKMAEKGHNIPNVLRGLLRASASQAKVSATAKGAKVTINGPVYATQFNQRGRELTATNKIEISRLEKHVLSEMTSFFLGYEATETVVLRAA